MLEELHYVAQHGKSDRERGSAKYDEPSINALLLKKPEEISVVNDRSGKE